MDPPYEPYNEYTAWNLFLLRHCAGVDLPKGSSTDLTSVDSGLNSAWKLHQQDLFGQAFASILALLCCCALSDQYSACVQAKQAHLFAQLITVPYATI